MECQPPTDGQPGWERPARLAETIAGHLEMLILEGSLRPGERLLAERDLAKRIDVSRPSLREALERLENQGLLRKDINGATFVAEPFEDSFSGPLQAQIRDWPTTAFDYLEFRWVVEGQACALAALRCTEVDRQELRASFAVILETHDRRDPGAEWEAEARLHLCIYEATHNTVLLHVMRNLFSILRADVFVNRARLDPRAGLRDLLLAQHRHIVAAVLAGDGDSARLAAEAHIDFTRQALMGETGHDNSDRPEPEGGDCPPNDPFARLLHHHADIAAFDYLEFRSLVAGEAAVMAATRATPVDLVALRRCLREIEAAHALDDPAREAQADADFHLTIYHATHNVVMSHIMRRILGMLRGGVFYDRADLYRRRGVRETLLRQHRAIHDAIAARDPDTARHAALTHLATIGEALRAAQAADARREVALRRRDGSGLAANRPSPSSAP